MRLRWSPVPRLPRPPAWASALTSGVGAMVLAEVYLERRFGVLQDTCLFHRLTGHSCPTCGTTRAVLALVAGHGPEAWRFNPLMTAAMLAGGALLLFRLASGRVLRLEASPTERRGLLATALVLLVLNWAWVLRTLG